MRDVSCDSCSLRSICMPTNINNEPLEAIDRIVKRGQSIKRGNRLFHASRPVESVCAVRSGSSTSYSLASDREALATGFYLPREILGLEGISQDCNLATAVPLEAPTV